MSKYNMTPAKFDLRQREDNALADAVISPMFREALYKVDSVNDLIDLVNFYFKFTFRQLRALKQRYLESLKAQLNELSKIQQPTTNGSEPLMSKSTDRILSFATFVIGSASIIAMLVIKSGTI